MTFVDVLVMVAFGPPHRLASLLAGGGLLSLPLDRRLVVGHAPLQFLERAAPLEAGLGDHNRGDTSWPRRRLAGKSGGTPARILYTKSAPPAGHSRRTTPAWSASYLPIRRNHRKCEAIPARNDVYSVYLTPKSRQVSSTTLEIAG